MARARQSSTATFAHILKSDNSSSGGGGGGERGTGGGNRKRYDGRKWNLPYLKVYAL